MNFKPEIKEISLIENVFSKNTDETVQCDIIVPDTLEDIGKILTADSRAVIESKEISGGRITVSGTVSTDILYAPQSGGIDALHSKMTFSHTEKAKDNMDISARCRVNSVDCSMYNSRKMNLRVNIGLEIIGSRDVSEQVLSSADSDYPVEIQSRSIDTVSKHVHACDVISFREALDIPAANPPAASVLKCDATLTDRDFRLLDNKAVIRGNLTITILYKSDEGDLSKVEFTKSITEITDAPGAQESMKENIRVTLSPFSAEPTANADGTMRAFFTEGKLFVETDCKKEQQETIVTDMFCTEYGLKLTKTSISEMEDDESTMLTAVRDVIPAEEMKAKKIFGVTVNTHTAEVNVSDGELSVSGKASADILVLGNNGNYNCINRTIPFSYNGAWDKATPSITTEAKGISAILTGVGDAEIRFTAAITAKPSSVCKTQCIANAEAENSRSDNERPSLVVYFAKPGDTLWNIAKKYGVTQSNILSANSIGDAITDGQKIIIPR